jgi:ABC-type branched-subunit amino acid transport system substrate-binding protein
MRWPHRSPRGSSGRLVHPYRWPRRHWIVSSASTAVVVLVAAVLSVVLPTPPAPCGAGMTAAGDTCVGLDLDATGFTDDEQLAALTRKIGARNAEIDGDHATIVLLDNMTPDAAQDSDDRDALVHRIEGVITAVHRANTESVAGGTLPRIKLLLASYGSRAESWRAAVDAITKARASERIAAVIGIGQSLKTTREAIAALSASGIATIGSVITADDMNTGFDGKHLEHFFRVAPTNTDEARALVSYLVAKDKRKVMLVKDLNEEDSYSRTLASAFETAYREKTGTTVPFTDRYRSPKKALTGVERAKYMEDRFAMMRANVCVNEPDVIVFAGRSADLTSFMRALSEGAPCVITSLDVLTGDDAANIAGDPLPGSFRVYYTALAHDAQWDSSPAGSVNRKNYDAFAQAFYRNGFGSDDLADGHAMISHDAALTATTAIRLDPLAVSDPSTLSGTLIQFHCANSIPGASGPIELDSDGNPINKVMPMLRIRADGFLQQERLVWPEGAPRDPLAACR